MTTTTVTPEDFLALSRAVGVDPSGWDLMLAGDGSGGALGTACGWAVCCHYRPTGTVRWMTGGASHGTSNMAELWPYCHALWAFEAVRRGGRCPRVLVVSDSELTVRCGTGEYARSANLPLWAALEHLRGVGYELCWRHVRRNTSVIGTEADRLAVEARKKHAPAS